MNKIKSIITNKKVLAGAVVVTAVTIAALASGRVKDLGLLEKAPEVITDLPQV